MSDQPQGAGWWQASDGKWYPPSQASQASPPPTPGTAYGPPTAPTGPPPPGMAYPAGAYPVAPGKQGMSGCAKAAIVIGVLALLLGGGCVVALAIFGDEVVENIDESRQAAREDVRIASCELDETGFMVAEVEVTNHSSERSDYVIEVGFRAADGSSSLETVTVFTNGVLPDESVVDRARSLSAPTEEQECRIVEAFRFSAERGGS